MKHVSTPLISLCLNVFGTMMISNLLMFLPKESLFVGKIRGSLLILFNFICGYVFPAIFTDADNSFEVFARSYDQVNALCVE